MVRRASNPTTIRRCRPEGRPTPCALALGRPRARDAGAGRRRRRGRDRDRAAGAPERRRGRVLALSRVRPKGLRAFRRREWGVPCGVSPWWPAPGTFLRAVLG